MFHPEAIILTGNGWKPVAEIIKNELLVVRGITGEIRLVRQLNIPQKHSYRGKMAWPIGVTKNHHILGSVNGFVWETVEVDWYIGKQFVLFRKGFKIQSNNDDIRQFFKGHWLAQGSHPGGFLKATHLLINFASDYGIKLRNEGQMRVIDNYDCRFTTQDLASLNPYLLYRGIIRWENWKVDLRDKDLFQLVEFYAGETATSFLMNGLSWMDYNGIVYYFDSIGLLYLYPGYWVPAQ